MIQKRFQKFDKNADGKHTGFISFANMQTVLKGCSWITPKEMNLLLRDYAMNQGYDQINYSKLPEDLYYIRFELANS